MTNPPNLATSRSARVAFRHSVLEEERHLLRLITVIAATFALGVTDWPTATVLMQVARKLESAAALLAEARASIVSLDNGGPRQ